jgi:hypothetical protein
MMHRAYYTYTTSRAVQKNTDPALIQNVMLKIINGYRIPLVAQPYIYTLLASNLLLPTLYFMPAVSIFFKTLREPL